MYSNSECNIMFCTCINRVSMSLNPSRHEWREGIEKRRYLFSPPNDLNQRALGPFIFSDRRVPRNVSQQSRSSKLPWHRHAQLTRRRWRREKKTLAVGGLRVTCVLYSLLNRALCCRSRKNKKKKKLNGERSRSSEGRPKEKSENRCLLLLYLINSRSHPPSKKENRKGDNSSKGGQWI